MIKRNRSIMILTSLFLLFFYCYSNANLADWNYVSFEKSVTKVNPRFKSFLRRRGEQMSELVNCGMTNNDVIEIFKSLYKTNKNEKIHKIPKIIHQIWIGSELPERYKALAETWKKHHPDWEYKLWTDKDIETFDMHNRDLFDQASNYAEKADIWRYEILYQYGGLYVDTDFKCLKPLDVLHEHFQFYCGMENIKRQVNISNALIGSIAQHPILQYCIENMRGNFAYWNKTSLVKNQFCLATCVKTGIFYLTKAFVMVVKDMREEKKEKVIALPPSYLYLVNGKKRKKREAFDESFAVHLYDGTWYK